MTHGKPDSYLTALLQRNHNVAFKFPKGYCFFKVVDYEDSVVDFDNYNSLARESSSATLNTGSTGADWNRWLDGNGFDILKEKESGFMLQAFIGINEPALRLWKRFPSPNPRGNLDDIKITSLDKNAVGYLDGSEAGSPWDMPTVLSEMIIPSNFPNIEMGIFNSASEEVNPRFKVPIRRMEVQAYKPNDVADRNTINDIISGRRACKVFSPGMGDYGYDANSEYGVQPIPWKTVGGVQ